MRRDKGDGYTGYCVLTHPKYGRLRLPLTADPDEDLHSPPPAVIASVTPSNPEPVLPDLRGDYKESQPLDASSDKPPTKPEIPEPKDGPDNAAGPHKNVREHLLYNVKPLRVGGRSERVILLRLPDALQKDPDVPLLVKPLEARRNVDPGVKVCWSVSRARKSETSTAEWQIPVKVVNHDFAPITIPALTPLAELEAEYSEVTEEAASLDLELQRKLLEDVSLDPDNELTREEIEQTEQVILKRFRAFADDPSVPGATHALKVHLPLKEGALPIRHAPPRLGPEARAFVDAETAKLERAGTIYKTNESPWGSRVVLAKKKDGGLRLCIDFRDVNKALQTVDSPTPRVDQCLTAMTEGLIGEPEEGSISPEEKEIRNTGGHGPKYWCTVDLASGFQGIPLDEESQPITAFVTPSQKYAFRRLPYGLAMGPSQCQNLMSEVLCGLQPQICVSYMDDTIIWARNFPEILERLDLVLERFENAGLTLKASKCVFMATNITFLGHVISRWGVSMDPAKTIAIDQIPPTSVNNITAVRSFLGCCSFYRKHIRSYAQIAKPLIDLTKKDVDVAVLSQEPDAQLAIQALKRALCTAPVLAMPQWNKQWIVHSDASITGLGAVLSQEDANGNELPVSYWSRVLTGPETRYSVTALELLAVINCLKHWRHYLWSYRGKPFILWVDHAALLWLHTAKETEGGGPASKLQRWFLKLQEYNFVVKHKPGRIHHCPDFLSRMAGNPEYEKLTHTPEHVSWTKIQSPTVTPNEATAAGDADFQKGGGKEGNFKNLGPTKNRPTINICKPENITFLESDILDTPADIIGHQCHCEDTRAWGLSRKIFDLYPEANTYLGRKKAGPHQLGTYSLTPVKEGKKVLNLYAQQTTGPPKNETEQERRIEMMIQGLNQLMETLPLPTSIGLPSAIGAGHNHSSLAAVTKALFQWATENPKVQLLLHHRPQDPVGWNPETTSAHPEVTPTNEKTPNIVAAVRRPLDDHKTLAPGMEMAKPIAAPNQQGTQKGDLTIAETVALMTGISAPTPQDAANPTLNQLERTLRQGRLISSSTIEAALGQLKEEGLGRRASELLDIAIHADLATKKGHYFALAATHAAGLHLQSAPILRSLNVDYQVRPTNCRKALDSLRGEFEPDPYPRPYAGGYLSYIRVAKIAFVTQEGTEIWCHSLKEITDALPLDGATLDLLGGATTKGEDDVRVTLRREIRKVAGTLPPTIQAALEEIMRNHPLGQARAKIHLSTWEKMLIVHIWVVTLPTNEKYQFNNLEPEKCFHPDWRKVGEVLEILQKDPRQLSYGRALQKAVRRRRGIPLPMTLECMPWRPTSTADGKNLLCNAPSVERTPEVRHLRSTLSLQVASCRTYEEITEMPGLRKKVAALCLGLPRRESVVAAITKPREIPSALSRAASSVFTAWKQYSVSTLPYAEELRKEQQRDLWCREIMDHLLSEYIPPRLKGSAIHRFCALAADYTLKESLLFRRHSDPRLNRSAYQLAIPASLREAWLEAFHDRLGHPGIERSYQALRLRAYWPGMREHVVDHVTACHECAFAKKDRSSAGTTIIPAVPTRPFELIYADVLTLPESNPTGPYHLTYSKLLIFCDGLTRWVEAIPLPSEPNAEEVVDAFVQNVVCRHGVPRALVCDRGSNLIATLCRSVYELLGVDLRPSTSYHHQTAGMVERFNRSLNNLLRATDKEGRDWPLHVPWLCFYFRATPHSITKESPAYLNLGRELRYPHERRLFNEETGEAPPEDLTGPHHSAAQLEKRLKLAWEHAGQLSLSAQQGHKERRDLSRREPEFHQNQWVLLNPFPATLATRQA